jgi:two-component system response regulator GlrR
MSEPRVLLIDDDENILTVLEMRLKAGGYEVHTARDGQQAKEVLSRVQVDVVLSDLRLEYEDGLDIMADILAGDADIPVLILTAHGSISNAVDAMKRGAAGYLTKPVDRTELFAQLKRCVANRQLAQEVQGLRRAVQDRAELEGIVGASAAMRRVFELVERLAPTRLTVAIQGESGTGKELVAHAIHGLSPRANREFLAVNCAALPEGLLQSELFGHRKGSFTGADRDREGLFQRAHGGTLFLDEIGDMSPALQASLLRVLQEGEVRPVGSQKSIKVDVRVVVATHRDLRKLVDEGAFRKDLYYRVNVATIHLPPLRDRGTDIELLAQHFLSDLATAHGRPGLSLRTDTMAAINSHAWPGNVRELRHAIERAMVMSDGDEIGPEALLLGPMDEMPRTSSDEAEPAGNLRDARQAWEKLYLERLLRECTGNVSEAARRAGKYRSDLYNLLRKHGIEPQDFKG